MPYERELQAALEAAQKAGQLIQAAYKNFTPIPNARASITTDTDRDSQETILTHLQMLFPNDAFCAEEETPTLARAERSGSRQWVVDPIDGTRGFAMKNGEFSVMVALVEEGQVVVGVVLEPATERLTYAIRGGGCWRMDGAQQEPIRCQVTRTTDLSQATLTQTHTKPGAPPSQPVQVLKPAQTLETYSAGIKLALVARGVADLYVNFYPNFHDWDIAAGQVLVEEAGGKVTTMQGQLVHYGSTQASQRQGLLASNGFLHEAALASLS